MSLPRYEEYKDSGVDWIGSVPAHWDIVALKHLLDIQNGADHKNVEQAEGFPVIGSGGQFAYASTYLYDGESVLLGRKGTIDKPLFFNGPFWTVDTMYWSKVRPGTNGRYAYYATLTIPFDYYSTNTALPSMTKGALSTHLIARPTLDEQSSIAAFLDRETAKIDALIAEQEKLIALLAEKRQATISHAVIKGINPHVPMKDSGVAWLGKVPAHWVVMPLKYLVELRSGGTPSKDNLKYWDGDVPWASAKDLKVEKLRGTIDCITQQAVEEGAASIIPAGAVLVVVRGMILARMFPVVEALVPMAINQDLKAVMPLKGINASFLAWLLRGSANESLQRLDEAGHGTKALRMDAWTSMQLPIPPLEEQVQLVEFISQETAKIDALRAESEHGIELLKERRSALISAAVTGQIDVRSTVPHAAVSPEGIPA
ncbi:restriction endonuclease subunit S [Oxalobacteraceae bacterium A2-2]